MGCLFVEGDVRRGMDKRVRVLRVSLGGGGNEVHVSERGEG